MTISIKIHSMNIEKKNCVVTVKDNGAPVLENTNIGLELNPDGTANTDYIIHRAKIRVRNARISNTANSVMIGGIT